jgi:hypothetical protein
LILSWPLSAWTATVLNETFTNDSGFTKSDAGGTTTFFRDIEETNEYWGINDPTGSGDDYDGDPAPPSGDIPPYTGFGGKFLNVEDTRSDAIQMPPVRLDWSNLNISGFSELAFSGLFAARGDFDQYNGVSADGDFIKVQYRIDSDSAAFKNLIWFAPETSPSEPDLLRVDHNFDGIGTGTGLGVAAQTFTAPILETGSTLDIRIILGSDETEEIAFDSITVTATDAIPGDFNLDRLVDASDFVMWSKTNLPSQGYNLWQTNFGRSAIGGSGAGISTLVPEPPAVLMLALALAFAWLQPGNRP